MAIQAAILNSEDTIRLREADANRAAAEAGPQDLTFEEAARHVQSYYELLEELHELYDLDPEDLYEFDCARGIVFKDFS